MLKTLQFHSAERSIVDAATGFEPKVAKFFWYLLIVFLNLFLVTNCEALPATSAAP